MTDFPSGPALDEDEGERLAVLMRDSNWSYLDTLLKRIWEAADKKLNKLGQTPEVNGYYKGIKAIATDLREMPGKLGTQLSENKKQTEDQTHEEI